MRKFFALPFVLVSVPLFVLALLIRFGCEDATYVLNNLGASLQKIRNEEG